jgi:perosamine synthetase
MSARIPIAGPWITDKEIQYVREAVTNGWYANSGKYQGEFEQAFAAFTDRRYGIALPSCTAGLHLALMALGIGPGDEVVVPDVTWIATSAPISYVGATAVFADFDPASWCITAASIEAVLTPRTRAVIVVDLYGNMPDFDAILELCDARNIAVIEDAAEAAGAPIKTVRRAPSGPSAHSASMGRRRSRPARAAFCCSTTSPAISAAWPCATMAARRAT